MAHLNGPAPVGAQAGVTRYLYDLYLRRPDLQRAYPDLAGADAAWLVRWALVHGREEVPIPDVLLPGGRPPAAADLPAPAPPAPAAPWGANVLGPLAEESGLGASARLVVAALETAGVPVAPVEERESPAPFGLDVVCLNPPAAWRLRQRLGAGGRRVAGLWWWELPEALPLEWWVGFDLVDEVWAPSSTVAAALRGVSPVPVHEVRLPVAGPPPPQAGRSEVGLPEGFVVLTVFDHDSFERKNPLAAIEAYRAAFGPRDGARLVLKSVNGHRHPGSVERVRAAAAGRRDIVLRDGLVSRDTLDGMLGACDCYVSLHRAEGFGLPLARAMALGRPAVATGFSGNLDYMDTADGYLVGHELVPVGVAGLPYYPPAARWAQPDVEHAATQLRAVHDHPLEARARGARAARRLGAEYGREAAARTVHPRLAALRERMAALPG